MQSDANWGSLLPQTQQPLQQPMLQQVPQQQQPMAAQPGLPAEDASDSAASRAIKREFEIAEQHRMSDIGKPNSLMDWLPILSSILLVLAALIISFRYMSSWGKGINNWYNTFGISAIMLEVGLAGLIFFAGRWAYDTYVRPKMNDEWSLPAFIGTVVGVQLLHHLAFGYLVVKMTPTGENAMLDVIRQYSSAEPFKAISGHSTILIVAAAFLASILKAAPKSLQVGTGLLGMYAIPYALTTREKF
jgi:hypothetical protein